MANLPVHSLSVEGKVHALLWFQSLIPLCLLCSVITLILMAGNRISRTKLVVAVDKTAMNSAFKVKAE